MTSLREDAETLIALARGLPARARHADALDGFYRRQADAYDGFRDRLLHGRRRLVERLPCPDGAVVIELGGGTGRNIEFLGQRRANAGRIEIVDLCRPLLDVAERRWALASNVHIVQADASTYRPEYPADCVFFSYSLSMMPDWRAALDNALSMLRPGGTLGVVDYYVSDGRHASVLRQHGWLTRAFWPAWFGHAGVRLSGRHLPYLCHRVTVSHLEEARGSVPYLPVVTVPYYVLIGTSGMNAALSPDAKAGACQPPRGADPAR